jgi:ATP-dependent Lon protease
MATSLVSLISARKVRTGVGMTGEITLRGQVLPVGGIKEKVLAAHRNGLRTIILPKRNKMDLDDVPDEIKKSMKFVYADTMDDVLSNALEPAKPLKKPAARKTKPVKAKRNAKSNAR